MIELNRENFDNFLGSADKPVLVDFWASWCAPCGMVAPVLEKLSEEYGEKIAFTKLNVDESPDIAQRYRVEQIPMVVLFKNGKPESGFLGAKPEEFIKEWLEKELSIGNGDNEVGQIIDECEKYAQENGFQLNPDKNIVSRTIKGVLNNEKQHGKRYCPCRRLSGNEEEDNKKVCPCAFHKKEIEEDGHCACYLFVKK